MSELKPPGITETERKLIETLVDEMLQSVGWADLESRLDGTEIKSCEKKEE